MQNAKSAGKAQNGRERRPSGASGTKTAKGTSGKGLEHRHSLGELAMTGIRDMPRNAAWVLSKALRPAAVAADEAGDAVGAVASKGRRAITQASSGGGRSRAEASVESKLELAARAAEAASSAEAQAMRQADEARRTAEVARSTAESAEARLAEAEAAAEEMIRARVKSAEEAAAERLRRAEQELREQTERIRAEAEQAADDALAKLSAQLDDEVLAAREEAEEAARRAEHALVSADGAVARARELSAEARHAAEQLADEAAHTIDRLRWDDRGEAEAVAPTVPEEDLEDFTKAELLELAAQAEIDGRSSMNKSELVEALSGLRAVDRTNGDGR